ncbi:hypothetical protein [Nocardia brasiliensis]|uniref:hypothetical protein n=1 Tax=Nocardia brasiliensis TaxID=37326 RepID=UPI0002DDE691|nr:hypothetical protein [Nocardia brasiliensis]
MAHPESPAAALPSAPLDPGRSRDIRRELLLMRAFQSRLAGPLLRRFADPQRILETGMGFWSSRVVRQGVRGRPARRCAARLRRDDRSPPP